MPPKANPLLRNRVKALAQTNRTNHFEGKILVMKNQLITSFKNATSLKAMGGNIKLARQVRGFTLTSLASYSGISRSLLYKIEAGDPTVAIGAFYAVLQQLGLEEDFAAMGSRKGITADMLQQNPAIYFRRAWSRKRRTQ